MLASIQRIDSLTPITGADKIETARILGWDVIVKIGTFHVGSFCVFIQTDTIIPKWLLTENKADTEKVRLKTIKMKGQISQGLALPLNVIQDLIDITEYQDVTDLLGIEKYEKPIPQNSAPYLKGGFPRFIPKTDEERIQNEPELLKKIAGKPIYITQKVDGTSTTIYKLNGELHVCSRNYEVGRSQQTYHEKNSNASENVYWRIVDKYNLEEVLPEGYYIQGEIYGEGINKNNLGITGIDLAVFSMGKIISEEILVTRFDYLEMRDFCMEKNLQMVKLLYTGYAPFYTVDELVILSNSARYMPSDSLQEGIVVRTLDMEVSFKVINPHYSLANEE